MTGAAYAPVPTWFVAAVVIGLTLSLAVWFLCRMAARSRPTPEPDAAARLAEWRDHVDSAFRQAMGDTRVDLALWEDELGAER